MNTVRSNKGLIVIIFIALLVIGGTVAYALSAESAPTSTSRSDVKRSDNEVPTDDTVASPTERAMLTYTNNGFSPSEMTVARGTTISVKNESSKVLRFASDDHETHDDNSEMNLGTLQPGESGTYKAQALGTWKFHDHNDQTKTGTITVKE